MFKKIEEAQSVYGAIAEPVLRFCNKNVPLFLHLRLWEESHPSLEDFLQLQRPLTCLFEAGEFILKLTQHVLLGLCLKQMLYLVFDGRNSFSSSAYDFLNYIFGSSKSSALDTLGFKHNFIYMSSAYLTSSEREG